MKNINTAIRLLAVHLESRSVKKAVSYQLLLRYLLLLAFMRTALLCSAICGILALGSTATAQTFTTIKNFGVLTNATGTSPRSELVQGPDGTLYGTAADGEVRGTVFKVNSDGTGFTVLKWFTNSLDGANPSAGVTLSGSTLYGTTSDGGSFGFGTVFKVNTDGSGYTVLKHFTSSDGAYPFAAVTLSGSTLYGTTQVGGSSDRGTVFKVNTDGSGHTVLKHFDFSDGAIPLSGLTLSGGALYGTTSEGGHFGFGTVFKLDLSIQLMIQLLDGAVVLSWADPAFALQSAPAANGTFTTIPGAASPYTSAISAPQQFFRLIGN
jgi:uncharacterized repeat protein (TIGR03803 family)